MRHKSFVVKVRVFQTGIHANQNYLMSRSSSRKATCKAKQNPSTLTIGFALFFPDLLKGGEVYIGPN